MQNINASISAVLILMIFSAGKSMAFSGLDSLKGNLLYSTSLEIPSAASDWVMEGPGITQYEDGWMRMYSENEEGHHVFWCPQDFPESFIAQWELQNLKLDAGLCIVFFAATGAQGESIFDPVLQPRDGVFSSYTKSDINSYHISYYAHTPNAPNRPFSHLRKNAGFHKVHVGEAPLSPLSANIHLATLIKRGNHIVMYLDDRKIIDWQDDSVEYGPVLGKGKIGFRQMQWTHFRYRNFRVWNIAEKAKEKSSRIWPRHIIDNSLSGADGIKLADINKDGKLDIVTGWEESGITKLYINPGPEKVTLNWPSVVVGKTPSVEDAVFMDMDHDGYLEIVSCTENKSEKIFVHRAIGNDLLRSENWYQEVLPASKDVTMWMYAEPVQVDGLYGQDLVAAGKGEQASIGWFEAPAEPSNLMNWTWHKISPVGWIMSILVQDMDQDLDLDIIISDRRGALRGCRWLENPGSIPSQKKMWDSHRIGADNLEVMFMTMADLDQDGMDEAIVSERTHQTIRIYKANQNKSSWQETIIQLPDTVRTAKSVEIGDLNGDKVPDFVISTNTNGKNTDGLFWLDGNDQNLTDEEDFQTISGAHNAKYDKVELIDLDEDGDLDVLICEENFGESSQGLGVIWYENQLNQTN